MAQTVLLKRSSVAGNVPGSSDLALGEIAVNTADGAVYIKKGNNDIVAVADNDILHIDTSNSRVGIGTTSPSKKFEVHDNGKTFKVGEKSGYAVSYGPVIETNSDAIVMPTTVWINNSNVRLYKTGTSARLHGDGGIQFGYYNGSALEGMRLTNAGNVGIGETSPDGKLHIKGGTATGDASHILFENTQGSKVFAIGGGATGVSNNNLFFRNVTDNTRPMVITDAGNVGIGTDSPTAHSGTGFVVHATTGGSGNTGSPRIRLTNTTTGQSATDGAELSLDGNTKDFYIENREGQDIIFYSGSERMRIDSSGKVGIGTTSPNSALHIQTNDGTTNSVVQSLMITNLSTGTTTTGFGGEIRFQAERNSGVMQNTGGIRSIAEVNSGTNISSGLRFDTSLVGVNATALDISCHGNVTFPKQTANFENVGFTHHTNNYLYLRGGSAGLILADDSNANTIQIVDGSSGYINFETGNGTSKMRILSNGNVGIGTSSPTDKLHVVGDQYLDGDLQIKSPGVGNAMSILQSTSGNVVAKMGESAVGHGFLTLFELGVGDVIKFDANANSFINRGNFGIGDTTPDAKLTVQGDVLARDEFRGEVISYAGNQDAPYLIAGTSGYTGATTNWNTYGFQHRIKTDSGGAPRVTIDTYIGEAFTVTNTNRVGIGTTTPTHNLHVKSTGNTEIDVERASGAKINLQAQSAAGYIGTDSNHVFGLKSNSAVRLKIATSGAITFNDAYTFPTADGSANQVLKTDGSGNLTFQNDSGGGGSSTSISDADGDTKIQVEESTDEDKIRFDTAGTERMRIGSDVQIIGTTDLQVTGSNRRLSFTVGTGTVRTTTANSLILATNSTTALTLDSSQVATFANHVRLADSKNLQLGSSQDFQLYHNGTTSYVRNYTGNLDIINEQDDGDIAFYSDNSSGGITEYFRVDGGITKTVFSRDTKHLDGKRALFGTNDDLRVKHDGTNGSIDNHTGDLLLRNNADDKDIVLQSDNGSGGLQDFVRIDGSGDRTIFSRSTRHNDNVVLNLGASEDLQIYHDSTNSFIRNYTGNLYIDNTLDDKDILLRSDDGSGGVATYFQLDGSQAQLKVHKNMVFFDSVSATFGSGADATILHDGSHFRLRAGTGNFNIQANDFHITDGSNGSVRFVVDHDGETRLFHNANLKLTTQSYGVDVTGELQSDSLDVDGNADISGNLVLGGNLTVNGTQTTLNTATLTVDDLNITVADGAADAAAANGAGLTVAGAGATLTYTSADDEWNFNKNLVVGGKETTASFPLMAKSNTSHQAFHIEENSGTESYQMGVDASGDLNFYNSGSTTPMLKLNDANNLVLGHTSYTAQHSQNIGGNTDRFMAVTSNTAGQTVGYHLGVNDGSRNSRVKLFMTDDATAGNRAFGIHQSWSSGGGAPFVISMGTNERLRIDTTGKVGIGTTTPASKLHIESGNAHNKLSITSTANGGTGYDASIDLLSSAANSEVAINMGINGDADREQIKTYQSAMSFRTNNTERMRIDSSGNVGIGDTAPAHKLTVASANNTTAVGIDIGSHAHYNFEANSTSGYSTTFNMDNSGLEIGHDSASRSVALQTNGTDRLTIGGSGNTTIHNNLEVEGADVTVTANIKHAGDGDTYYGFHGNDLWRVVTGGVERIEVGNTGIRVNDSGIDMDFTIESNNDANMFYLDGGNDRIGIGTSSPAFKFSVDSGTSDWPGYFKSTDNKAGIVIADDDTTGYFGVESSKAFMGLQAGTHANNLNVMNTGKVGLGTTSPSKRLHVLDSASHQLQLQGSNSYWNIGTGWSGYYQDFLLFATSTGEKMVIDTAGKVGIGTNSPTEKLHIAFANTNTAYSGGSGGAWGSAGLKLENSSASANTRAHIHFRNNDSDIHIAGIRQATNDSDLGFFFEGSEKVRFTNNGNVGINKIDPKAKFQVEEYGVDTTSTASSATTQIAIHSFAAADFRSARFTVQVTNSTDSTYHTTELLLVHDGTTANITEFGEIHTGSAVEATFDSDVNSGYVRLLATPASTDTMAFKVVCHSITT